MMFSGLALAIPDTLTLQGKLTNSAGTPQSGTFNFSFKIYDDFEAGTTLYESNRNITTDANGIYDVILKGLGGLNFSSQYYLGITLDTDAESTPRINLTSSPYAFRANVSSSLDAGNVYTVLSLNADTINATNITAVLLALGWANLTNYPSACNPGEFVTAVGDTLTCASPGATSSAAGGWVNNSDDTLTSRNVIVDGTDFVINTSTNNVGIGTSNPTKSLVVIGSVNISDSLNVSGTIQAANFIGDGSLLTGINIDGTTFNLENFTANYDAITARFSNENFTTKLNEENTSLWNASGNNIFLKEITGNVGIGTTTPGQKLHVEGSANISTTLNAPVINTTRADQNITINSGGGSIIIRLG